MTERPQPTEKPERYSDEWVKEVVSYHQPNTTGLDQIARVRLAAMHYMREIIKACPDCADRTAAIRHVRDAMMSANASIVLCGLI